MGSEHEQIGRSGEHVNGYNSQRDGEKVRNALVWNKSVIFIMLYVNIPKFSFQCSVAILCWQTAYLSISNKKHAK